MSDSTNDAPVVDVGPRVMSRVGYALATLVFGVFIVIAIVQPRDNAGAHFNVKDQWGTVLLGVILGGMFIMLTRPRVRADAAGVHLRSFLGGWRDVPWDLIVAVEFPSKVRFGRLVLPGEETLAMYAVQRFDRDQSIDVMRTLRAMLAASRPAV